MVKRPPVGRTVEAETVAVEGAGSGGRCRTRCGTADLGVVVKLRLSVLIAMIEL